MKCLYSALNLLLCVYGKELFWAAGTGNKAEVERLLNEKANLHWRDALVIHCTYMHIPPDMIVGAIELLILPLLQYLLPVHIYTYIHAYTMYISK